MSRPYREHERRHEDYRLGDWALCAAVGLAALAAMGVLLTRCTPAQSPSAPDVFAFTADQIDCVEQADSRPAADACRAVARATFCHTYPNASVCPDAGGGP